MIDDDDVMLAALIAPVGGIGAVIGLIVVIVMAFAAYQNHKECEQRACPGGQEPRLMDHACLCVEAAQ